LSAAKDLLLAHADDTAKGTHNLVILTNGKDLLFAYASDIAKRANSRSFARAQDDKVVDRTRRSGYFSST
jgi:hypothetical protein